ncbi:MAG: cytochrome P450 [Monoraphidium minutum]|nr:MAG: cytochrome P450 [Monoraphidium minutum]
MVLLAVLGGLAVLGAAFAVWLFGAAASAAWRMRRVPSPKAPSIITGHLPAILSDRAPLILAEWAAAHGPLVRLRVLGTPMVLLSDPGEAARVLRRGPEYIPKARQLYAALEAGVQPQTANLLTADDGPMWKAVRSAVAPAFSASSLKQALPWVVDCTRRTAARIGAAGPGAELDVADAAKRITSDVMGSLLFGEDLGAVDGKPSEYLSLFNLVLEATHQRFTNPLRPAMALWDKQARREQWALAEHDRLLGDKVAAIRKAPPPDYTITGHLLNVVDPATGLKLSDTQLKAELAIVFGAGFETTSHAISWALGALAAHPEAQARLAAELAAAGLAPSAGCPVPRDFEWSDMARLPYLAAVIKETLRLFSPGSLGTTRLVAKPIKLCGHVVPAGVMVMVSPYVMGVQPRLFPGAEDFRPERWLHAGGAPAKGAVPAGAGDDGGADVGAGGGDQAPRAGREAPAPVKGGGAVDPYPFSLGPRDCVGRALADLELQAVLASLVGRYAWTGRAASVAELKAGAVYHVTLQPGSGGMMLRAEPRAPAAA